jgi:hypothetical protein
MLLDGLGAIFGLLVFARSLDRQPALIAVGL